MPRQIKITNEQVIDQAMVMFWANGYRATSPQMIAEKLDISVSSVYNKYGKDELFLEGVQKYIRDISGGCIQMVNDSLEGKEVVSALQYMIIDSFTSSAAPQKCFVSSTAVELRNTFPEYTNIFQPLFVELRETYRIALERGYTLGEIKNASKIPGYVDLIMGIVFALSILKRTQNKEQLRAFVDQQMALII